MTTPARTLGLILLIAVAFAGCTAGAFSRNGSSSAPAGTPGSTIDPSPSPSALGDHIGHPTGATDVVLRYDMGGGFVPIEYLAAHVPQFTLYGDGTVVFVTGVRVDKANTDGITRGEPLLTLTLTEDEIQALLAYAIGDGGLGEAKTQYSNEMVADAPTSTFVINTDDLTKTVSAYALGIGDEHGPDSDVKAKLAELGQRLSNFDEGGTIPSEPYEADAYRVTLVEARGVPAKEALPWPWPSVGLDDFNLPADPNALQQGSMTMTPEQIEAIGVKDLENGVNGGLIVLGPDKELYSVAIRPLLPDETA